MIPGIDVSNHQGAIDWNAVSASGRWFALCKASEGTDFADPFFQDYFANLHRVEMLRGGYHFARPNLHAPEDEADWFLACTLPWLDVGDVLALDLEEYQGSLSQLRGMSVGQWALRWCEAVEHTAGFPPLVYSSPSTISEYHLADTPELGDRYGLWLASWGLSQLPAAPAPWDLVAFWQYAGDTGRCPGVSGPCDLDWFNGTKEQFRLYGRPASSPPPPSGPTPHDRLTSILTRLGALHDDVVSLAHDLGVD